MEDGSRTQTCKETSIEQNLRHNYNWIIILFDYSNFKGNFKEIQKEFQRNSAIRWFHSTEIRETTRKHRTNIAQYNRNTTKLIQKIFWNNLSYFTNWKLYQKLKSRQQSWQTHELFKLIPFEKLTHGRLRIITYTNLGTHICSKCHVCARNTR